MGRSVIDYNSGLNVTEGGRSFTAYKPRAWSMAEFTREVQAKYPGADVKPTPRTLWIPGKEPSRGSESRSTISDQDLPGNWMTQH